jgi:glycogen(starch) synthase
MQCAFEVSWEVCNKVGGIYTVIESKAEYVKRHFEEYYFIGPYFPDKLADFEEQAPPKDFRQIFEILKTKNILCHYGAWTAVHGSCILIDFSELMKNKNKIKGDLWQEYKIDSLSAGEDFDEPVTWATAAGMLLEEISNKWQNKKIIIHFHEWLSGAALLYLKKKNIKGATVFATHSTVLGRAIADANKPLYSMLEAIDPEKEAYQYNIAAKHQTEKASALNADVFTTVSKITALETEYLLGRKADLILINGVNFSEFPDLEAIPQEHKLNKERIKEFLLAYFFPYYTFDIENCLFYFISGRYEFHNKGIDIFIEGLKRLNEKLKKEKSKKRVVVFFFIPVATKSKDVEVLENNALTKRIEKFIEDNLPEIRKNLLYKAISGTLSNERIFSETFVAEIKKLVFSLKKKGLPPITIYELVDGQNDIILNSLQNAGLTNKEEDRIKVIYYGSYLSSSDGLLGLDYYSAIWGCHLGVFPSYYEPWGYTPIESAAHGVPSITTDLSGFGKFVEENLKSNKGIFVLKRESKSDDEVIDELADYLYRYTNLEKEERINSKIVAENFVRKLSWENLISEYIRAYKLSLARAYGKS